MADPIIGRISVGDGATFTPAVSEQGVLSWSNNKNLTNPASVDIPQAVIDRYQLAPVASPAFTGTPTAPTPAADDDSTKIATTAYVQAELEDYATLNDLSTGLAGYLPLSGGTMTGALTLADGGTALSNATVGTIVSDTSSNISVGASSISVVSVSLAAGVWVVTGTISYSGIVSGRQFAGLNTSATMNANVEGTVIHSSNAASSATLALTTTRIFSLSATTTVNLNGYVNGGTVTTGTSTIRAVRIK